MDSVEEYDPTLPLDVDGTSINITRFDEEFGIRETSVMSDPGHSQMSSANLLTVADGKMSPSSGRTMKDFTTQISELKKENFSLKLRIFYMEDRMQDQFNNDYEHVFKTNIELKVECDSLRKELQDKHDLLVRASNAVACLEAGPEEARKAQEQAQRELQQVKDTMHEKVQQADRELRAVRAEAGNLADNVHKLQEYVQRLEEDNSGLKKDLDDANAELDDLRDSVPNNEITDQAGDDVATQGKLELLEQDIKEKDKIIDQLRETLEVKRTMLEALTDERNLEADSLQNNKEMIKTLEDKNKDLEDELKKRKLQDDRLRAEYSQHISEQQQRLDEFEIAARQMSEELEKREEEVRDLTEALKDAEETGKELADNYDRLKEEKEEKKSKELVMRDKAISGLTEVVRKKDEEIRKLHEEAERREFRLEELSETISKLGSQEVESTDQLNRLKKYEKQIQELRNLKRDLEATNRKLISELENSDELVRSLDEKLKEKDKELQSLLSKYKDLLKKQQDNERAKEKACRDQEDMAEQFEKEKNEFAEIVSSMKRQFEKSKSNPENKEKSQKLLELQEKLQAVENLLQLKQSQLEESQNLCKRAEKERKDALDELDAAMKRRDEEQNREIESRNRMNAAKMAEIERLREEIRLKDDRIQNLEDDVLQLDRTAHDAAEKSIISGREAARWKEDSNRKNAIIEELTKHLETLGHNATHSDEQRIIKLTRENVELKQLLKAKEAEITFLQNEQSSTDPYVESLRKEIARKDKIIADERSKISEDTVSMNLTLDTLRLEVENHKRELSNAKSMVESLTAQLESTKEQMTSLQKECQLKDRMIKDMKSARHFPTVESEEGSSTATEKYCRSGHRRSARQQRYTKKKSKHRRLEDEISLNSSSTNSLLRFSMDNDDFDAMSLEQEDLLPAAQGGALNKDDLNQELMKLQKEIEELKGAQRNEMDLQRLLSKLDKQKQRLRRLTKILSEEQELYRRKITVTKGLSHSEDLGAGSDDEVSNSKHQLDVVLSELEEIRNRLKELLLDVPHSMKVDDEFDGVLRQSLTSTILPANQTSYLQLPVPDESNGKLAGDQEEVAELRNQLEQTKAQLEDAHNKLLHWESKSYGWDQVRDKLEQENKETKQRLQEEMKEGDLKDVEMSALRIEVDKLRALQLKIGKNVDVDCLTSGDESDGMGALSRKELKEFIANLQKKLKNAEKLNELLGDQIESARQEKSQEQAAVNPDLTKHMSSEIARLKDQLQNAQEQLKTMQSQAPRTSVSPTRKTEQPVSRASSKSKLPVPVEKHQPKEKNAAAAAEKSDYAQLIIQNSQLQKKLAATEETVRQQTEKLKKAKAAIAAAGLDVPLSPVKSARSHPNIFFESPANSSRQPGASTSARDGSSDNTETRIQTSADDTGYMSVTPKSERRYNFLIQTQAKELSTLRQQLKKARETCKDLRTEYDIVSRYITTLLTTSEGPVDTMLATSVSNELERCKQLTRRLKKQLSEWTSDASSATDSDDSMLSRKSSLAQRQASQIAQKSKEIEQKNKKIQDLEEQLQNLLRQNDEPHFLKKSKGQKYLPENLGYLTPTSSHHSILTNPEEEISSPVLRETISRNTEYASLPERRTPRPRSMIDRLDDSIHYSPRLNKSLPMYQRTIAVTEYLPPAYAGDNAQSDAIGGRHLPTTADAEACTASYGGSWRRNATPRKAQDHRLPFNAEMTIHSSPSPKHDSNEIRTLKRKLDDCMHVNESLKEELDLTTEALNQAKNQGPSDKSPADILEEHLREIRILRQRLENSIETNDRLREQLEKKLKLANKQAAAEHVSANIYLPAETHEDKKYEEEMDSLRQQLAQANEEVEKLKNQLEAEIKMKDNYAAASLELEQLRMRLVESSTQTEMLGSYIDQLNQAIAEKDEEIQKFRDSLEQFEDELKAANDRNEVSMLEANSLRQDADTANRCADKMKDELNRLNEEVDEGHNLVRSLKSELALYEKYHKNRNLSDGRSPTKTTSGRNPQNWNFDISEFLAEIKSLRVQLERSIEANSALRKQLQEQLRHKDQSFVNSPGRTTTINIHHLPPNALDSSYEEDTSDGKLPDSGRGSTGARRKLKMPKDVRDPSLPMTPPLTGSSHGDDQSLNGFEFVPLPNNSLHNSVSKQNPSRSRPYYDANGNFVIGKTTDYNELKQVITDGRLLVRNMELKSSRKDAARALSGSKTQQRSSGSNDENLRLLHRMLEDSGRLLKHFWPAFLPPYSSSKLPQPSDCDKVCQKCASRQSDASSDISKCTKDAGFASDTSINSEADGLRCEVRKLHKRLSAQDKLLQSTVDRLQTANRLKEGIEHAILRQLTVTHDVLKKARGNLEAKTEDSDSKERNISSM